MQVLCLIPTGTTNPTNPILNAVYGKYIGMELFSLFFYQATYERKLWNVLPHSQFVCCHTWMNFCWIRLYTKFKGCIIIFCFPIFPRSDSTNIRSANNRELMKRLVHSVVLLDFLFWAIVWKCTHITRSIPFEYLERRKSRNGCFFAM